MKNVLIISYEFPPIIGGAGVYAHDLAIGLVKNGHQVSLLTYRTAHNEAFLTAFEEKYGIRCYTIPAQKYIHFYLFFRRLKQLLQQQDFDIVLFSDARAKKMGALFQPALKQLAGRSLSVLHGGERTSFFEQPSAMLKAFGMQRRMDRFLRLQKKIVVVSEAEYEAWMQTPFKANLELIRHGIDTDIFYQRMPSQIAGIRSRLGIEPHRRVLLSASRLVKEKGQEMVIASLPEIVKTIPDLLCIIAGNGAWLPVLQQQVKNLRLEKHVYFTGGLSREVLSEYLAACDLFILPSQFYESFGLVYLEAAACGKTSIAGNRGGTNEAVVNGVTGYLVDPLSKEAITSKVMAVLQDGELRASLQITAWQRAMQQFSNVKMAEKIINTAGNEV
ncbi:glycosyltransferase family 4 protein [Chitinophaga sp. 30R24]|uniref:glycosyltransferase family 4 protein n=1 Tax=Chitinophaga sp. 30R24 TaxID=3248838 RepID=UPI003B9102D8